MSGENECLLRDVLQGQKTTELPVWLMRQAGRYLPEYRAVREKAGGFMQMALTPEYAAEVTLQPLRRFDLDGAILFSDILMIPHGLGQQVGFHAGEGPVLGKYDFASLRLENVLTRLNPVFEAVKAVRADLPSGKTLIGFAGAPWTVACYMIQSKGGGEFEPARLYARQNPVEFAALIGLLTEATIQYLSAQIEAGAMVVQIFDSWSNLCPGDGFADWIIAPTRKITQTLQQKYPQVPVIGFARAAGMNLPAYATQTGVNAIGIDQFSDLLQVKKIIPAEIILQGNLDPQALLTGGEVLRRAVDKVLEGLQGRQAVFNLGHGIIKETPPEHVTQLIEQVKAYHHG